MFFPGGEGRPRLVGPKEGEDRAGRRGRSPPGRGADHPPNDALRRREGARRASRSCSLFSSRSRALRPPRRGRGGLDDTNIPRSVELRGATPSGPSPS